MSKILKQRLLFLFKLTVPQMFNFMCVYTYRCNPCLASSCLRGAVLQLFSLQMILLHKHEWT